MQPTQPSSLGIRHVAVAAQDLKRAARFYTEVLGFTPYHVQDADWEMFRIGGTTVSLILHEGAAAPSDPKAAHPAHFGINVESKAAVDQWHAYLSTRKLPWLTAPKLHRDGSYGFYLKDSEGNPLELIFIPQLPKVPDLGPEGYVLIAHGSSDPKWRKPFEALLTAVERHAPGRMWKLCYMESCQPTLEEAVEQFAAQGRTQIRVVPVFLATGAHVTRDLPTLLQTVGKKFPTLELSLTTAVGETHLTQQGLIEGIFETLGF